VNSSFPRLAGNRHDDGLAACTVAAHAPLAVAGRPIRPYSDDRQLAGSGALVLEGHSGDARWLTAPRPLLALQAGRLAAGAAPMLFTLERHPSTIDTEDGPRPYVYDVGPHGLIARWRGSALAWPLLDTLLIGDDAGRDYLCALHRGDSFIMLDPARAPTVRTMVYGWTGFGFSGVEDEQLAARCRKAFAQ
jgi:hypothetical protein